MLSSLLLASTLSFGGFPEVPVGPVTPLAQVDSSQPVSPPPPDQPLDEDTWDERDQAARDRAARDRAVREANERTARERAARRDGELAPGDDDVAAEKRRRNAARPVEFRALATTTLPMNIGRVRSSGDLLVGLRGELDIGHASALFSWDRGAASIFNWRNTLLPTSYWNALIGPSVWATRHNRIRLLAGLSAVSTSRAYETVPSGSVTTGTVSTRRTGAQFGPTLGATVHLGIPVLGVEGAILYTPVSFQQLDARLEVVLRLLIIELRGGYRARWIDTSRSSTQVPVESTYGPTISAGFAF